MPCWTFLFRALSSQVTLQLSEPGTVWCEMLRLSAAMKKIKRFCDVVVIDVYHHYATAKMWREKLGAFLQGQAASATVTSPAVCSTVEVAAETLPSNDCWVAQGMATIRQNWSVESSLKQPNYGHKSCAEVISKRSSRAIQVMVPNFKHMCHKLIEMFKSP